ncbi:hypothetical protein UY3_16393 [Chelonia mydas]|uniref:Uncharacterized protein n=1 Tax=Chelonia mydas TaxID=8469 RepID=M7AMS1_CHEMY|nr:hypothetical protein UY3_16393 [Chelonia mydas]
MGRTRLVRVIRWATRQFVYICTAARCSQWPQFAVPGQWKLREVVASMSLHCFLQLPLAGNGEPGPLGAAGKHLLNFFETLKKTIFLYAQTRKLRTVEKENNEIFIQCNITQGCEFGYRSIKIINQQHRTQQGIVNAGAIKVSKNLTNTENQSYRSCVKKGLDIKHDKESPRIRPYPPEATEAKPGDFRLLKVRQCTGANAGSLQTVQFCKGKRNLMMHFRPLKKLTGLKQQMKSKRLLKYEGDLYIQRYAARLNGQLE